jgi:hypothetical protein
MIDRRFTEIDLRRMLSDAQNARPDAAPGMWVGDTSLRRHPWKVVVEPEPHARVLVVATAYPVDRRPMRQTYLEVTFRRGRALAAYLCLPRLAKDKSSRSVVASPGLVVDYTSKGKAIGVEITSPATVSLAAVNRVLRDLGALPLKRADLEPLRAA